MNNNIINDESLLAMTWKGQVMHLAKYDADERIIRALIRTMPESEWIQLESEDTPTIVYLAIETLFWEKDNVCYGHKIKEQPKYRPVKQVLNDFFGTGKRQDARKELRVRLPYLTALEQKQILYAFMDSDAKLDRIFACKYLDEHYEPMYQKAIETIWELHHDSEAAKVITHYAPYEFVAEHFEQLANDYSYLPVRLRMSADYPIDNSQLEEWELLHLCARQHLPITEQDAFIVLSNTLHKQLAKLPYFSKNDSLYSLRFVSTIISDFGHLGFKKLILRFFIENEKIKQFLANDSIENNTTAIQKQIYNDGFYYFQDVLKTKEYNEIEDSLKRYMKPSTIE